MDHRPYLLVINYNINYVFLNVFRTPADDIGGNYDDAMVDGFEGGMFQKINCKT